MRGNHSHTWKLDSKNEDPMSSSSYPSKLTLNSLTSAQNTQAATQSHLHRLLADSTLPTVDAVPHFEASEVVLGKELGIGEFGVVHIVKDVRKGQELCNPSLQDQPMENNGQRMSPGTIVKSTKLRSIGSELDISTSPCHTSGYQSQPRPSERSSKLSGRSLVRSSSCSLKPTTPTLVTKQAIVSETEATEPLSDCGDSDDDSSCSSSRYLSFAGYLPLVCLQRETSTQLSRESLQDSVLRHGTHRYALKTIKTDLSSVSKQRRAIQDLAAEARFLQALPHSNIVRLRATVGTVGTADFGLFLDRLIGTLEDRIEEWKDAYYGGHSLSMVSSNQDSKRWWQYFTSCSSRNDAVVEGSSLDPKVEKELRFKQLLVCLDIGRALAHLHSHQVLYRDLKPANMGFNVRGDVQIFDFGFAKELKQKDLVDPKQGTYLATGLTGSLRYMAPEVVLCEPYGKAADVYSYALVVWQVFALEKPFTKYRSMSDFNKGVLERRQRPPLDNLDLSQAMKQLIQRGWTHEACARLSFQQMCRTLQRELEGGSNSQELLMSSDRTVFLRRSSRKSFEIRQESHSSFATGTTSSLRDCLRSASLLEAAGTEVRRGSLS